MRQEAADEHGYLNDTVQLVTFQLGDEKFGIDVNHVKVIVKYHGITKVPHLPPYLLGVMNLRGQITMVLDLARRFGTDAVESGSGQGEQIIVVELNDDQFGMLVDEVDDVTSIPEASISSAPKLIEQSMDARYVIGICQPEDEEGMVLLLDLEAVFDIGARGEGATRAERPASSETDRWKSENCGNTV